MRRLLTIGGAALGTLAATSVLIGGLALAQASGIPASRVLGQPDFTSSDCPEPPGAANMCTPAGIAIDAAGRLWVADADNNRVLSWPDAASFGSGQPADRVLGQSGFVTSDCPDPPSAASMCYPQGVAFDASGRLFVADADNNRVLSWANAASAGNGQPADLVLGQRNFTRNDCDDPASASTLCYPQGIAIDASGRLFVADGDNNRVLSWPTTSGLGNGQAADRVLGQPDLRQTDCPDAPSASSLCTPTGLAIDSTGRLWVSDSDHNRVLSWPSAAAVGNGQPADRVLGQPNFGSTVCNAAGPSASSLCNPMGIAIDNAGRLYVSDGGNERVLSWPSAAAAGNGAPADRVLGSADFGAASCSTVTTAGNFCSPDGIATDSARRVYVADGDNNRVLAFEPLP